jgi:hypothetical protein
MIDTRPLATAVFPAQVLSLSIYRELRVDVQAFVGAIRNAGVIHR